MENEKCNFGVEWSSASLEQQIRQIVREEIAAHEERLRNEEIRIKGKDVIKSLQAVIEKANHDKLPVVPT